MKATTAEQCGVCTLCCCCDLFCTCRSKSPPPASAIGVENPVSCTEGQKKEDKSMVLLSSHEIDSTLPLHPLPFLTSFFTLFLNCHHLC
jgi:hypothetical protein